ncbi:orotate phosphoribosyltransferase [Reinekea forsetii]|uniref:Orotate phosphoribosyltransferase n=1 Tax=Reinekea forsetii TaxID=1336806 RepID=A0A2K8KN55_9GAMM|nr:orotate phosphoribosyltransferase [Reinekea forsetii]ATX75351.1 orotate phosphoribosyltransferase [Reinekea forsetii]
MNSPNPHQSTAPLQRWQKEFIEFAIHKDVLQFGDFTLKSGRQSPYFFNAGKFDDGQSQQLLGEIYARTLIESGIEFDSLFGPAYKGIPLATSTVIALNSGHHRNVPFTFNRKEAKAHGEGGQLVGAPLSGRVILVDDVITAGTAIRETLSILENHPDAQLVAAVVLIDRQEKLQGSALSAIQALERDYGLSILPAIRLDQIMAYIAEDTRYSEYLPKMAAYRAEHGID